MTARLLATTIGATLLAFYLGTWALKALTGALAPFLT